MFKSYLICSFIYKDRKYELKLLPEVEADQNQLVLGVFEVRDENFNAYISNIRIVRGEGKNIMEKLAKLEIDLIS